MISEPLTLPIFGNKAKAELAKSRIDMNMTSIHSDCKEHIKAITGSNGYLKRAEWDCYAKAMVKEYPQLAGSDENKPWVCYNLALQGSRCLLVVQSIIPFYNTHFIFYFSYRHGSSKLCKNLSVLKGSIRRKRCWNLISHPR